MTIDMLLKAIQDFRLQLDQWGVTAEGLIAVAFLAGVMFVISLREVMSWFLRVGPLREEIAGLRADIAELKKIVADKPVVIEEVVIEPAEALEEKAAAATKSFRLDH